MLFTRPVPPHAGHGSWATDATLGRIFCRAICARQNALIGRITVWARSLRASSRSSLSILRRFRSIFMSMKSITMTPPTSRRRSEEHTSELQSQSNLVCRLLLEKKNSPVYETGQPYLTVLDVRDLVILPYFTV